MATVKKADLRDAVRDEVGVTYLEAAEFVDTAIEAIASSKRAPNAKAGCKP